MEKKVVCSAPGKVLLTGGYMILDRPNSGLVMTVNARFYTVVETLYANKIFGESNGSVSIIEVYSPQFRRREHYRFQWKPKFELTPLSKNHKTNEFTEKTILHTLVVISGIISASVFEENLARGLSITILGDNDFYSQRDQLEVRKLPMNVSSLASLPKFLPAAEGTLETMKKTGLGSSAALVTSLVGGLLSFFGAVQLPSRNRDSLNSSQLAFVHNLAQYTHCLAQGKIGSGFDVSSATYGSHRYVRFSKEVLEPVMKKGLPTADEIMKVVKSDPWDNEVKPIALPKGLHMVLGDVSKGSNTPNMVSKILKWKSENVNAPKMVQQLIHFNTQVEGFFFELVTLAESATYLDQLKQLSVLPASKWAATNTPLAALLLKLRDAFIQVRYYLREIGNQAQVDVEPSSQQELTDATMELPGVLISGVPGAGGYDAVFAIMLSDSVFPSVEKIWMDRGVLPLILKEESKGVCLDSINIDTAKL